MNTTMEEVQALAIQKAAARQGVTWQAGSNTKMTKGMKLVIAEARKRGIIIQSERDLTSQVIDSLAYIMVELAEAFSYTAMNLAAINQQIQGMEYAAMVWKFNKDLLQQFAQHLFTLNSGVTKTMFGQLGPFEIESPPQTWIQRLLMVDD